MATGDTLLHYRLGEKIGQGGMGEIWGAADTKLGRSVALKILPADLVADAERRVRFEREARTVAALSHPNIVTLYSVEQAGEVHFITMELVKGKTLGETIPRGGLPVGRLLDLATDLADAVTAAHRKGITHRDLKPDNVMVGGDGRLKVLDFGLAKLHEAEPSGPSSQTEAPTRAVTQEGRILGTVAYMAPEQAEGKPVDARSDVFSLGVILYEMATGNRPFKGDTQISTITSILRDTPPSITELNQTLPRHLGRIVRRCLEKDAEKRYQTAQDLRNDLDGLRQEVSSGELTLAPQPGSTKRRPARIAIAAGLALAAISAAVVVLPRWLGGSTSPRPAGLAQTMRMVKLTSSGDSREATISPDGRYVAYLVTEAGRTGLWVVQVSTGSRVQIVAPDETILWDPTYSPDGEFLYYVRGKRNDPIADLYRVPALGGSPRKVLTNTEGRVSFSPDGRRFVFLRTDDAAGKSQLVVANVDGSGERVIAERALPGGFGDPAWSPRGGIIAAPVLSFEGGYQSFLVIVPEDGGKERRMVERAWFEIAEIAWYPDGSGLVIGASGHDTLLRPQIFEIGYPDGTVRRVTNDTNDYHGVGLTADGRTLVTQQNEATFNLWVTAPGGTGPPVRITSGTSRTDGGIGLGWTPEGKIVFSRAAGGEMDLWMIDADGFNEVRLTANEELNVGPVVTPDGRQIVFASNRAGTINLWKMALDGSNAARLTSGSLDIAVSVSPDGRSVYFLDVTNEKLMTVPIGGGEPSVLLEGRIAGAEIAPDGNLVAASMWDDGAKRYRVRILPRGGGPPIATLDLPDGPFAWTRDAKMLTYVDEQNGIANLWNRAIAGGPPVQVTDFDKDGISAFKWSPDGSRLVLSRGDGTNDIVLLKDFH